MIDPYQTLLIGGPRSGEALMVDGKMLHLDYVILPDPYDVEEIIRFDESLPFPERATIKCCRYYWMDLGLGGTLPQICLVWEEMNSVQAQHELFVLRLWPEVEFTVDQLDWSDYASV